MRPRRTWILALPVAGLLIAGCGGGGDDDSTEAAPVTTTATAAALTQAELIEQGDAICAEVNAAIGTIGASSAETANPVAQVAELYGGMVENLMGLGRPQEGEGYAEFAAAADGLATTEDEVKLAAEREDSATLETVEVTASTALASFQAAAQEYGFEECSAEPSAPVAAATPETGEAEAGQEIEEVAPETVEPEAAPEEEAPEVAPETGGAGSVEGGGTGGAPEGAGSTESGSSGGVGPG